MKKIILVSLLVSSSLPAFCDNGLPNHQVSKGENLGQILFYYGYSPIWGKNGYVEQTIKLNPKTITKNGNFVDKNAVINLPSLFKFAENKTIEVNSIKPENESTHVQKIETTKSAPQVIKLKPEQIGLSAGLNTKSLNIDSKDKSDGTNKKIDSDPGAGFRLSFDHIFSDNWAYGAFITSNRLSFSKPSGHNLKKANGTYNEFGISTSYYMKNARSLSMQMSLDERPLLYRNGANYSLERLTIPKFSLSYSPLLLENKKLQVNGLVGAAVLFPMQKEAYYINTGHAIYTGVLGTYQLTNQINLISGLHVDYSRQHTSLSENRYTEVAFNLGVLYITDAHHH
jgi:hypothetical protein